MNNFLNLLWLAVVGYILGSIPFGVLVGYVLLRRDVRAGGSGHSGATNMVRQAGWKAGVLVALLDIAKGYAAGWLAVHYGMSPWAIALACAATVAGHCWPVLAGWRGGMGLGTLGGYILAIYPLGFVLGLGLAAAGSLILRHSARGNITAGLLFGPVLWLFSQSSTIGFIGAAGGLVIAVRSLSDWNRVYKEVWLDRGK
jgi:glycerol-3-phosphate acyltransferase PlsY